MIGMKPNYEVLKEIDKLVVGHTEIKKSLINAINRSKMRFFLKYIVGDPGAENLTNDNIMLIGGSGSGKTYILDCLSHIMEVPFCTLAATDLTLTGASSDGMKPGDINQLIEKSAFAYQQKHSELIGYVSGINEIIEQSVVFIDEIDKLAKAHDSSGGWHRQVQATFLKMFDNNTRFKDVIFVFAGAFDGIEDEKGINKNSVGFYSKPESENKKDIDDEDVIRYGLIPEFVGRCGQILTLEKLTAEHYTMILNNLILPDKNTEFDILGIPPLTFTTKEEETIIQKTIKSGQGVRTLKREVNKIAVQYEFDCAIMNEDSNAMEGLMLSLDHIVDPLMTPTDSTPDNNTGESEDE